MSRGASPQKPKDFYDYIILDICKKQTKKKNTI